MHRRSFLKGAAALAVAPALPAVAPVPAIDVAGLSVLDVELGWITAGALDAVNPAILVGWRSLLSNEALSRCKTQL